MNRLFFANINLFLANITGLSICVVSGLMPSDKVICNFFLLFVCSKVKHLHTTSVIWIRSKLFGMNNHGGSIITIQEGALRGTTGRNLDGDAFHQFLGIPYAQPPINQLRFKPPQPIKPWMGIRDATKEGSPCIIYDGITQDLLGSEDCLYLNVYTRNLQSTNSRAMPVMVWIHGGGFVRGSGSRKFYGPDFLMIKDIVLVTLNYRLGALGFMCLDDPALGITGNMGLKDQNMALQWVQRNIQYFNGDPSNVTIFGESAGSASVHAHVLSSASKGLFHKAILQSGVTLNPFFWGTKNNAKVIVAQAGKSADTGEEVVQVVSELSGVEIFSAQENARDVFLPYYHKAFGAIVEEDNGSAFISKHPRKILEEASFNQVPMMIGYNETEGMLLETIRLTSPHILPIEFEYMIPYDLREFKKKETLEKIRENLKQLYSTNSAEQYDELTDGYFLIGYIEALMHHLRSAKFPIYMYRISLSTQLNFVKRLLNKLDVPGTNHADDLGYLFHSEVSPEIKPGSVEDKSIRIFVELWTNFAEFGNPTPNEKLNVLWPPVESYEKLNLLEIGEELRIKDFPERKRLDVWRELLP